MIHTVNLNDFRVQRDRSRLYWPNASLHSYDENPESIRTNKHVQVLKFVFLLLISMLTECNNTNAL